MANNQSTFTLKLKTEGMDQAQAGSKQIRENLEGAQRAASTMKMARSAAAQPTGMAGASAGIVGREVEEYNRAAGAAGKAGGTARDFADQARGLGGLVRLYATVAANAFAAAAAFTALSNAMDTTNMVKGLDQLGAASGVALGSLSKRLVTATDGAVSLREAMEATVKASSAGLDTSQILQLGDVSKKAAQALGLNMTDALSRLTRGITKLEPELLDELGIFVRIDDATSKYALSVGKSTSALTDFERRQAFANAVLEQGKKKFDEIKIDSNPYAKLAAAFQNLTQSVLEFVNKGLAPVAKFLSENTTLLGAVFAFVALKLTQAALPALGQWQEGLVKAAQTAKASAREINTSFGEAFVQRWTDKLRIPELQKQVEEGKKSLQSLAGMVELQGMGRGKAALGRILAGGTEAKDIKTINTLLSEQTKKYEEAFEANNRRQNATTRALQAEISFYQTAIDRSKALAASTRELTEANKQFNKSAVEAPSGLGERAREMTAKAADRKAQMYSALADVSTNVLEEGIGSALKKLNTQLNVEGVGYVRRFTGLAIGAFSAVTTGIGIFANAIQGYLAVFTFIITLGAGILNFFSNTKKESEATSEAFTRLEGGLKTTRDTLERISMMKDPLEQISVESVQAKANALKELGDAAVLTQTRAFDEIGKMNIGDKIVNAFKGLLDSDVQTKLANNITDSIVQALKLAEEGPAKQQAKKTLEAILGTDVNASNLGKKVATLVQTGDREKIAQVTDAIQRLGFQSSVSAAKGTEFKESIKKLTTDIQEFNKSLTPTDAISKFAQDGIQSAQKLKLALDDPTQSLQAMITASNDVNLLAIFPPDVANVLMNYNKQLKEAATRIEEVGQLSKEDADKVKNLNLQISNLELAGSTRSQGLTPGQKAQIESLRAEIRSIEAKPLELQAKVTKTEVDPIRAAFDGAVRSSLIKSSEMMGARIAAEVNKAQTVVLGALAGLLGDTEVGIKLRTEIELKSIDASNAVAKESFALATQVDRLRIQMERRNLLDEKKEIKSPGDYTDRERQIDSRLKELDRVEEIYNKGPGKLTSKGLRDQLSGGREDVSADLLQAVQKFEALNAQGASAAAQKEAVRLKERIDLLVQAQKKEIEILDVKIKQNGLNTTSLNTQKEMGLITDEEYIRKSNLLGLEQISAKYDKAKEEAGNEYNRLSAIGTELFKQGRKAEADQTEQLAKKKLRQAENLAEQQKQVDLQDHQLRNAKLLIETEQKKFDKITKEIEFRDSLVKAEDELAKAKSDSARQEIEYLANTDRVSKEYAANRIAEIAVENQAIGYQSQLREAVAQRDAATRAALNKAAQEQIRTGDPEAGMVDANTEIERANQLYAIRTAAIEKSNTSQIRAIELTRQASVETAKQNEELKKQADLLGLFESIANTLGQAFGKTGEVLGKFVSSIGSAIDSQQTYNREREKQSKIIDEVAEKADAGFLSPDDMARMNQAIKTRGDLDKKNAKDEITNNAKILGSAKTLFKEKTAAHKILAGAEKAMHVTRLAMEAKELFVKITGNKASLASKVTTEGQSTLATMHGALSRAPFYIGEIYGKTIGQLGPIAGPIVASALAALVMSYLGGGGGGKTAAVAGTSSQDRQETQGTGMSWVDGKKVETGGGVFGDPEAKTDPIRKSLEKISETSVDGVFENRRMVKLLESIDRSIGNAAKGLYSIPGLRAGSAFGTVEGTNKSGNILFGSMFSTKRTKTITDSGILIEGTFRELAGQVSGGIVKLYEDVVTTTKKWYGKTKSSLNRQFQDLPEALSFINEVFSGSGDLFVELGSKLAIGKDQVWNSLDALGKLKFEGSLRGLKGEELNAEVQAIVGSQLDKAAISVFGVIVDKFKEFGESALETVIRIVDETEKGLQALGNISTANGKLFKDQLRDQLELQKITVTNTSTTAGAGPVDLGFELSQEDLTQMWKSGELFFNYSTMMVERLTTNLATAITTTITRPLTEAEIAVKQAEIIQNIAKEFGNAEEGFDKFLTSVEFFRENFLTEAERLAPVKEMVIAQLGELGLGFVDTRDEFKGVVQSLLDVKNPLGVTTEGGQKLLATLLQLAPAFNEVYKAAEPAIMSVEEFAKKVMGNEVDILKSQASMLEKNKDYQGAYTKLQESLLITRKAELTELEKLPKAQGDVLIAQAKYKWSLEDIANEARLVEQLNREIADGYRQQITVLQKFVSYLDEVLGLVVQAVRLRADPAKLDLEGAKTIERTIKLQDISNKYAGDENKQRRENIIGIQKYIWALEDEQEAKNKYLAAAKTYADAINLQVEALQGFVNYLDEALGMVITASRLRASEKSKDLEAATNIERRIALQNISNKYAGDENKVRRENIIGLQEYIWALEDEKTAKDLLIKATENHIAALQRDIDYYDEFLGMVTTAIRLRASEASKDLEAATHLDRKIALQDLSNKYAGDENKVRRETLIGIQEFIWTLEDEQEAKNKLITATQNYIDALQKSVDYYDEFLGMVVTASRLRASEKSKDLEAATNIERRIALQNISNKYAGDENKARRENIIGLQNYIWALEDEKDAKDKLIEATEKYIEVLQKSVDYYDEVLGMISEISKMGSTEFSESLGKDIERSIALQNIQAKYANDENKTRAQTVIGLQKYIWALEDEQEAKDNLAEATQDYIDVLQKEIDTLQTTIQYWTDSLGMLSTAFSLLEDTDTVKTIERAIKTQDLQNQYYKEEDKTRLANILSLQNYIWALEDEKEARDEYLRAISNFSQAIQTEISKIEVSVGYFDRVLGSISQALQARGRESDLANSKAITRAIELQNIQKEFAGEENKIKRDTIIGIQNYTWALEDEQEAKDKYVNALNRQVEAAQKEISKLEQIIQNYDKLLDQKARISELKAADSAAAKLLARERELADLREGMPNDIADALVSNQNYIYALEDEQELKDKLIAQRDKEKAAIEETITSLESAIKSLKEYSDSLLLSDQLTVLTPEEQYLQAKKTFENVLATAQAVPTDEKSRAAQLEAINKLPEVSNQFLELSRTMYASSEGYISDFNLVRKVVQDTASGLEVQLTDAQLQLKELEKSTDFLNSIEQSTKTTADLLLDFKLAQEKTAAAAAKADTMSVGEITSLKKTAEDKISQLNLEIEDLNSTIEELTGRTLSYQETQAATAEAELQYSAASATALNSLSTIQDVISDQNIANILASRNEAITQISLMQSQLTALQNIETSVSGTLTAAQAETAFKTAATNYGLAKNSTIEAALGVTGLDGTAVRTAITSRNTAILGSQSLQRQVAALESLDDKVLTKENAQIAFENANKDYKSATVKTILALGGVTQEVNKDTVDELVNARGEALTQISVYQKQLATLNSIDGKVLTDTQLKAALATADANYQSATVKTIAALAGITKEVNGETINEIVNSRGEALSQISVYQQQLNALNGIKDNLLTETETKTAVETANKNYDNAVVKTVAALAGITKEVNGETVNEIVNSRGDALSQISIYQEQLNTLKDIKDAILTKDETKEALEEANKNYDSAVVKSIAALAGISQNINGATVNEALEGRSTALAEMTVYQKQLLALNRIDSNTPTLERAEQLYKDAQTAYGTAKDDSIAALAGISSDINGATVNQALTAREIALKQIRDREDLIRNLDEIETNTYGVYQSQQQHYQSLINTPQEVNVGKSVGQILARIAANTAVTADNVEGVKNAVNGSTEAVVTTNATATDEQTRVLTEAISQMATNWQSRTVPRILTGSGILG